MGRNTLEVRPPRWVSGPFLRMWQQQGTCKQQLPGLPQMPPPKG